jgi:hypothetical protein
MVNKEQHRCRLADSVLIMRKIIKIVRVEKDGDDGMIVNFSDKTSGAYVAEELLELRPHREAPTRPAKVS